VHARLLGEYLHRFGFRNRVDSREGPDWGQEDIPSPTFSPRFLLHDAILRTRRCLPCSPSSECREHGAVQACTCPTRITRKVAELHIVLGVLGVLGVTSPNSVWLRNLEPFATELMRTSG